MTTHADFLDFINAARGIIDEDSQERMDKGFSKCEAIVQAFPPEPQRSLKEKVMAAIWAQLDEERYTEIKGMLWIAEIVYDEEQHEFLP